MTNVVYDKELMIISAHGHANSAPKGEDLVCCAVSTLMGSLVSALDDAGIDYYIHLDEQGAKWRVVSEATGEQEQLNKNIYDTIASGLRHLAQEYPENVSYKEE